MGKILGKLLFAFVVPTLVLFGLFGFLSVEAARRSLDDELGLRLTALAAAAATHVRAQYLLDMKPDEPPAPAYVYTQGELRSFARATGVERIAVFRPDLTSLCDTATDVPVGRPYHELELDRHELQRVFAGEPAASLLFRGTDGRWYKAGYVPLRDKDGAVVAGLRVEAPAGYFEALGALRARLVGYGVALAAAVVLASVLVAALLTRPLRRLAGAAERIGRGDLVAPVATGGTDEIGVLGRTLEEMRRALHARDERQAMMLAGIAHEVRNPLGGIELYAGILRDELAGDEEKRAHVARIERELRHLTAVVSEFLEYARRPPPELRPVELAPLLEEVAELVQTDGVTVATAGDARARADRGQLRRALLNLARNAVQASPAGGRVTLAAARAGERARVDVTDAGPGIARADQDKIFAPFYTTKETGVGLGLAFVREIVADHGGTLEVASEAGRGTTFTVWLPWA
jgi:signal transduction histidine kinase